MSDIVRPAKTTVRLSGSLAMKFWRKNDYLLESGTTNEVFSALRNTVDGFADEIMRMSRAGIRFAIFRNRVNVGKDELTLSGTTEIRIVPIIAGSKRGGLFQTIAGVALIVVGAIFEQPWAVGIGIGMVSGGVAQMLSPVPKTGNQQDQAASENKPSYLFNGAFNSTQQGLPVPVIYGKMLVGSSVIAVGTWAEAIPA
ncbi:tail assembly protein [Pseudomonas sp. MIL9]|uniref:tail assembly protein n=1 Tax=Pseudomonas sp. MIL9 TaxID=2807620 RepID=UPI00194DF40B|nr:tail assembly protein [Pseudomonas sp. MIL9]MBM6445290.1 tail assembly protein [Pseudomonas sp. MIL9]